MYTDLYCHKMLIKHEKTPLFFKIIRRALNIVFLFISLVIIAIICNMTKKFFIMLSIIVFLLVCVPVIIRDGTFLIFREKYIVSNQIRHNLPIKYNVRKVKKGYAEIFAFLWLFPSASFLLPGGHLWILIFPPIMLTSLLTIKLTEHTWLAFGFSKKKYWLMHVCAFFAISAIFILFRNAVGY